MFVVYNNSIQKKFSQFEKFSLYQTYFSIVKTVITVLKLIQLQLVHTAIYLKDLLIYYHYFYLT